VTGSRHQRATDAVPALSLSGIVKHFGSVRALDGASFSLQPATIHALLGENGAGKTTLMKVAFGMLRPDAGQVSMAGRPVAWRSPLDAIRAGVGMVHQHFTLVPAMTVAENVELGAVSSIGSIGWRFDRRAAMERVRALGRSSGLAVEPNALVEELSVATQQRVEILKALDGAARILILDEPTAVLAPRETEELLRWLRSYTAGGGTAVLITHKLREALAVADDVTVLRHGRTVLTTSSTNTDETTLTRAMIGSDGGSEGATDRSTTRASRRAPYPTPYPALHPAGAVASLEGVVATNAERRESVHATFTIHTGEIVGIAGVEGAGQYTLLRVLARRIRPTSGRLTLPSEIGFIPEDRHRDGLVLEFSLTENVALRGAGTRRGRMAWAALRRRTSTLLREFDVRAPDASAPARVLSGGNQQRLVLARELDGEPPLIVAENPTRGLDVRATADVHDRLRDARDAGAAVVFYSSDLDEVLALATRVIVVHAGAIRETPLDRDLVGRAMLGLHLAGDAKPASNEQHSL
jgi:ABC-type uncharacterized transport system ATPase subunit